MRIDRLATGTRNERNRLHKVDRQAHSCAKESSFLATSAAGMCPACHALERTIHAVQKAERLADGVKENLRRRSQEIYMEAYNRARTKNTGPDKRRGKASLEETAAKVAWAAVKKKYEKSDDKWHLKK